MAIKTVDIADAGVVESIRSNMAVVTNKANGLQNYIYNTYSTYQGDNRYIRLIELKDTGRIDALVGISKNHGNSFGYYLVHSALDAKGSKFFTACKLISYDTLLDGRVSFGYTYDDSGNIDIYLHSEMSYYMISVKTVSLLDISTSVTNIGFPMSLLKEEPEGVTWTQAL